jgi:hypothetical protein
MSIGPSKSHQEGVLMPTIADRMRFENPSLGLFGWFKKASFLH